MTHITLLSHDSAPVSTGLLLPLLLPLLSTRLSSELSSERLSFGLSRDSGTNQRLREQCLAIAKSVQSLLAEQHAISDIEQLTIKRFLSSKKPFNKDTQQIVISVSADAKETRAALQRHLTALTIPPEKYRLYCLSPALPGAWCSSDVCFEFDRESDSLVSTQLLKANKQLLKEHGSSSGLDATLHYASFNIPQIHTASNTHNLLQPGVTDHDDKGRAVVVLRFQQTPVSTSSTDADQATDYKAVLDDDIQQIQSVLERYPALRHLDLVTGTAHATMITQQLRQSLPAHVIHCHSADEDSYTTLYPLVTQAQFALVAGSGEFADMVSMDTPVYCWRVPDACRELQTGLNSCLETMFTGSTIGIVAQQKQHFRASRVRRLIQGKTLFNQSLALGNVLSLMTAADVILDTSDTWSSPPIIPASQPRVSLAHRIQHGLKATTRKLHKLRTSPVSFIRDSQHPLMVQLSRVLPAQTMTPKKASPAIPTKQPITAHAIPQTAQPASHQATSRRVAG